MTLPQLDEKCTACDGVGVVQNPEWRRWLADHESSGVTAIQHITPCVTAGYDNPHCPRCQGELAFLAEHPEPTEEEEIGCGECDGSGRVVTDAGRDLLAFLGRHPR